MQVLQVSDMSEWVAAATIKDIIIKAYSYYGKTHP
jgi:hypothetical protein